MKAGDLRVVIENPNDMPVGGIILVVRAVSKRLIGYRYITGEFQSQSDFVRPLEVLERVTKPASKLHRYLYGL